MSRRTRKAKLKKPAAAPSRILSKPATESDSPASLAEGRIAGKSPWHRWQLLGVCALIVLLVWIVFGQSQHFGFVNYDDEENLQKAPPVVAGLSWHGTVWALTHSQVSCWVPLTTLSHMLDCQIYGLRPGGHHLTNVLLHAIGAILLFLLFHRMTGSLWRSAFVAVLFAIHPLRVESVAWVSERKDVLSGIFFMLTLWAYVRWADGVKTVGRYLVIVLWFALGLMSKPMLVTLPFVLLLLDYWPLGRFQPTPNWKSLVLEKLPLFAMSALLCVVTVLAQKKAISALEEIPISVRAANAVVAYLVYVWKLIDPGQLTAFYPLSKQGPPAWQVITAALFLVGLTVGVYRLHRRQPFLLVGWLWYLGMLVPVIGIMQVGEQAYADRYTYLPQIGLCFAGTWAASNWAGKLPYRRIGLGFAAVAIAVVLTIVAYRQTGFWKNSGALWVHALECTRNNDVAHNNLGNVLLLQGRLDKAMPEYAAAVQINPSNVNARNNLAHVLFQKGRAQEAIAQYLEALRISPESAGIHTSFGIDLFQLGQIPEAGAQFREALRLDPDASDPRICLGNVMLAQGQTEEAISEFREALRLNPADPLVHANLGHAWKVLFERGHVEEAIADAQEGVKLWPNDAVIQDALAWMLATAPQAARRDGPRAVQWALQADRTTGARNPEVRRTLAAAYAAAGKFQTAAEMGRSALQLAEAQSNTMLANELRREIKLYESGHPFETAR